MNKWFAANKKDLWLLAFKGDGVYTKIVKLDDGYGGPTIHTQEEEKIKMATSGSKDAL